MALRRLSSSAENSTPFFTAEAQYKPEETAQTEKPDNKSETQEEILEEPKVEWHQPLANTSSGTYCLPTLGLKIRIRAVLAETLDPKNDDLLGDSRQLPPLMEVLQMVMAGEDCHVMDEVRPGERYGRNCYFMCGCFRNHLSICSKPLNT